MFAKIREDARINLVNAPEQVSAILGGIYWIFYIGIVPGILDYALVILENFSNRAFHLQQIVFCILNCLFLCLIFGRFLLDSWKQLRGRFGRGLFVAGLGFSTTILTGIFLYAPGLAGYPIIDPLNGIDAFDLLKEFPWGSLFPLIVCVPITHACLMRALVFGSRCEDRPWLAYSLSLLLAALPFVLMLRIWGIGGVLQILPMHLLTHLILCWVYRVTANIWPSIFAHMSIQAILCLTCVI